MADNFANALWTMPSVATDRYAVLSTNGGYDYTGQPGAAYFAATFALDPAKLLDFTQQSEHRSLPVAQRLSGL